MANPSAVQLTDGARRRLYARLIAEAHRLDVPFTNQPDLSPWKLIKRDMETLDVSVWNERQEREHRAAETEAKLQGARDRADRLERHVNELIDRAEKAESKLAPIENDCRALSYRLVKVGEWLEDAYASGEFTDRLNGLRSILDGEAS